MNYSDIKHDNSSAEQNQPEISVIVPIYNVEQYLNKCIESIINQTFTNIEIILVDDGSTDRSPDICDYYAKNDSRVIVIHKQNCGVAEARNTGIEVAKGRYFAFVDSDDFVDPDYLTELYNAAEANDCDISYCNYSLYNPIKDKSRTIKIRKPRTGLTTGYKICKQTIRDFSSRSYMWNKLYKRELFFTGINVRYPDMYFEDIATTSRVLYYAKDVVIINKSLYYYTRRKGSITSFLNTKKMHDYILSLGVLRNFFEQHNDFKRFKFVLRWLGFMMFFGMPFNVIRAHFLEGEEKDRVRQIMAGIIAGWKCIVYFVSKRFQKSDNVIPEMPYQLYERYNKVTKKVISDN